MNDHDSGAETAARILGKSLPKRTQAAVDSRSADEVTAAVMKNLEGNPDASGNFSSADRQAGREAARRALGRPA